MAATPEFLGRRGIEPGLVGTILASAALHAGAVALLLTIPGHFLSAPTTPQSYTVDLVAPDAIGGTNLALGGGPRKAPAAPPPPPVAEPQPVRNPAPVEPSAAAAGAPPKAAELPKPVEPSKPAELVKHEPPPQAVEPPAAPAAVPREARVRASEAKPPGAPVAEAKPPAAKPVVKPPEQPKIAAKPVEPPKPAAAAAEAHRPAAAKPAAPADAGPVGAPAKAAPAPKPATAAKSRDDQIAAAVQRRAAQVRGAPPAATSDVDQRIAAAVQRRAGQVEQGAGAGRARSGGPISVGPDGGTSGTPADLQFILYQGRMEEKIKAAWAWAGADKALRAVIQFNLTAEGEIRNVRTIESSGDRQYDASCERAVRAGNPLEPVPEKYRKEFATVEMTFKPTDLEH